MPERLPDGGCNFLCYFGFVHRVDMDTVRMMGFQIQNLFYGIINAGFSHICRIIPIGGYDIGQLFGNGGTGQGNGGSQLFR